MKSPRSSATPAWSTNPMPNSLAATSQAWPKSWEISSVRTERLNVEVAARRYRGVAAAAPSAARNVRLFIMRETLSQFASGGTGHVQSQDYPIAERRVQLERPPWQPHRRCRGGSLPVDPRDL